MNIIINGSDNKFDIETTAILFYPGCSVTDGEDGRTITVTVEKNKVKALYIDNERQFFSETYINEKLYDSVRCACKKAAYCCFSEATGIVPKWGVLTGVRPISFYLKMIDLYGDAADEIIHREYLVSEDKIALCKSVYNMRQKAVSILLPDSYSLYLSIPFCPSRCKYCSFVSMSTEKEGKYLQPYIDTLCREVELKAERTESKKPMSIYIGGGTPTVLSVEQLNQVFTTISSSFDLSGCLEYTVEAGRPETITDEKLSIMKQHGITRISVNPQTLLPEALLTAGRKHTVDDFFNAYDRASRYNFDINVDLIAGLELETVESFAEGLNKIIALAPANITIHSLYIKRAADFGKKEYGYDYQRADDETLMLSEAIKTLADNGYFPYYMYRQKNTLGNNENIGFAKKGKECIYNIYMMDDIQSVIACGANAMSKTVENGEIIRDCNTKFAYNYIKEFER